MDINWERHDLTLVIPTRDAVKYAEPAIASIASQTHKDRLMLLFVDESRDEFSRKYVSSLCKKYEIDFDITKPPLKGQIESITHGYKITETKYVGFFTLTDLYNENTYLSRAINTLEARKDLTYYHSNILTAGNNSVFPGLPNRYLRAQRSGQVSGAAFYANYQLFDDGINELTCIVRTETAKDILTKAQGNKQTLLSTHYSLFAGLFREGLLGNLDQSYCVIGRNHEGSLNQNTEAQKRVAQAFNEYQLTRQECIKSLAMGPSFFLENKYYKRSDSESNRLYNEYKQHFELLTNQEKFLREAVFGKKI